MLYDEWDKLLETRFVKKDDLMLSGETVTFGSYLVDLGEPCQGHRSTSGLNSQDKDEKLTKTSSLFYSYSSQNRKPMLGKRKGRVLNISPSQNVIRDFKRSEMNKFRSSPNCMDVTNLSTKDQEWQVLYTTQLTQKAKKFHDGFLQLIVCGSQGRQFHFTGSDTDTGTSTSTSPVPYKPYGMHRRALTDLGFESPYF